MRLPASGQKEPALAFVGASRRFEANAPVVFDRAATRSGREVFLEAAAVHSLLWLVLGNAVGVLLAVLLLAPELGDVLAPLTYGRWVPVHFDLQLYGWCALPVVALLGYAYLPRSLGKVPVLAVSCWSAALGLLALTLLSGRSSGKLFVEWVGESRLAVALALGLLEIVLVLAYRRRLSEEPESRAVGLLKAGLLAMLALVPPVLYWAAGPGVFPPVNPDSGGSTGTSLLGSSLGLTGVLVILPLLAGLDAGPRNTLVLGQTAIALVVHLLLFGALGHGDVSHHELLQIVGLSTIVVWWPLLARLYRTYEWPAAARRWLSALAVWSAVLLLTAVPMFLPGVLDRLKFTNALVAHSHLAMAGMLSSVSCLLLALVLRDHRLRDVVGEPRAFWLWNGGFAVMLVSLVALGLLEAVDPGRMFHADAATSALYGLRLGAGVLMLAASVRWLRAAVAGEGSR